MQRHQPLIIEIDLPQSREWSLADRLVAFGIAALLIVIALTFLACCYQCATEQRPRPAITEPAPDFSGKGPEL